MKGDTNIYFKKITFFEKSGKIAINNYLNFPKRKRCFF